MYAKTVTRKIVELQAKGFSGEETREYLKQHHEIKPCLDTIYRHRQSPTGIEMLHELIRQQERDILKCDNDEERELAMRYRDKLIGQLMDKLLPSLSQIESRNVEELKVEEKHVSIIANLAQYDRAIEEELKRISKSHSTAE